MPILRDEEQIHKKLDDEEELINLYKQVSFYLIDLSGVSS